MKKIATLFVFALTIISIGAQIKDPTDVVKDKGTDKVNEKTDDLIDQGLNKIEEGINSIFKKKDKNDKKKNKTNNSSTDSSSTNSGADTDFDEYKGSDFIPGKNLLFYEDFATAALGTGTGNWYLYEYDEHVDVERPGIRTISIAGGKWLKMPRKGFVFPNAFKNLPEQFTMEYDLYADPNKMDEMEGGFRANFIAKDDRQEYSIYWPTEPAIGLDVHPHGSTEMVAVSAITEYNSNLSREEMILFDKTFKSGWSPGQVNRVSIYRNGTHIKLYLNGKEMINLPQGLPRKAQYNLILSTNLWCDGMFVSNIRIAGDIPNATQEIKSNGKFVTNSIYLDVNSFKIKPESWATLNNAAQAIKSTSGAILINRCFQRGLKRL